LEIKVDERGQRYPRIEEKVMAILDRRGMVASTIVMAFERETWLRVRQLRPDVSAGALYSPRTLRSMASTASREIAEAGKAGVRFAGLHGDLVDADAMGAARNAGVTLGVGTVNEGGALQRFVDLHVGVLITARPEGARELPAG